jgi:hypothetical protein
MQACYDVNDKDVLEKRNEDLGFSNNVVSKILE